MKKAASCTKLKCEPKTDDDEMKQLTHFYLGIQRMFLPALNEKMGSLSAKEKRFVAICEVTRMESFMEPCAWIGNGRKPKPRLHLARAFLAKALWNLPSTRAIIDRLKSDTRLRRFCGWENGPNEVPDEATFSRAFAHLKMRNATRSQFFQPQNQPINLIPMKENRDRGPTRMECLESSMHRLTRKN